MKHKFLSKNFSLFENIIILDNIFHFNNNIGFFLFLISNIIINIKNNSLFLEIKQNLKLQMLNEQKNDVEKINQLNNKIINTFNNNLNKKK